MRSPAKSKRKFLWIPAALLVALMAYPYESTVVPAWRIRVVDGRGAPVKGELVRESWKHYSLKVGGAEGSEDQWSDEDGYVAFRERTVRANLFSRGFGPVFETLRLQAHASTGPKADIMVWGGSAVPSIVRYRPGEPLATQIALPSESY